MAPKVEKRSLQYSSIVTAESKYKPLQQSNTAPNPTATTTPPPPSTKRTGPSTSGPQKWKKKQVHREHYDAMVTLTGGYLEQIADAVTLATEDQWALIMAQWKAGVTSLQEYLVNLKINSQPHPI